MKRIGLLIFISLFLPLLAKAEVIINEVAWMGSDNGGTSSQNANDEWIELYNNSLSSVDLAGWQLITQDSSLAISLEKIIPANSFFLLERTDDSSVPALAADLIYTGALSNSGEILILHNASGVEVDRVDGSGDWQIGGNNDTKETLQRTAGGWLTAAATPRTANVNQPQSGEFPVEINQPLNSESFGSIISLENPLSIKATAGRDKTAVAGAEIEFKGEAYGLKNEPLENARYLWIFGDGTQKEGKTARHIYYFPGVYQAVLNVSSGYYSVSDYLKITVVANELFISEVKPVSGNSSWIEIHNPSNETIDISYFVLKSQGKKFVFPDSTFILPKSFLVVAESVSAISPALISGEVEFLNSAGSSADLFSYNGLLKVNESFNKINGQTQTIVAFESPGKETAGPPLKQDILPPPLPQKINQLSIDQPSSVKPAVNSEINPLNQFSNQNKDIVSAVAANTVETEESAKNNGWFWFLASLGMGIFSAVGFVFMKTNQER